MKSKLFNYLITLFTVAAAALIIAMLFTELINFDNRGLGSFILDTRQVSYLWPNGNVAITEDIWWMGPGLILAAVLLFIPLILNIFRKKAAIFFWINVVILAVVIAVQYWGVDHGVNRIGQTIGGVADVEYLIGFHFPVIAVVFSVIAALIYTFFKPKLAQVEDNG